MTVRPLRDKEEFPRFVIHQSVPPTPRYCWRSSWNTGFDSAYSLLSKFGQLNALGARELAQLFVIAPRGRRTALLAGLNIDLRTVEFLSKQRMAERLRIRSDALDRAFVVALDDRRFLNESSTHFRYCRACLRRGLHVAMFQYLFVPSCPLHGTPLVETCERCGGYQPYTLSSAAFKEPFRCIHCGFDFSPRLRELKVRCDLRLSAAERTRFADAFQVAQSKSRLFGSAQQLERHFSFFGLGAVSLSAPSISRSRHEYYEFIEALVRKLCTAEDLHARPTQGSTNTARILEVRCGTRGVSRRRIVDRPWLLPRSNGSKQAPIWDEQLRLILPVYRAVRRHVWRRLLGSHRRCVVSAARRLWWDVEGDTLERFCPHAEAFLRWRMFWEGFGVPADLYRAPRHIAFGVQAWLSDAAPICPSGWSAGRERWVAHRVFAMDCLRHYSAWQMQCESRPRRKRHRWTRIERINGAMSYWLVAGPQVDTSCTRLYLDSRPPYCACTSSIDETRQAHRRWHEGQVQLIHR